MSEKKARIELIDIAKAITIVLVILGHTTGNLETPMYRRLIYSFHMPLFFFPVTILSPVCMAYCVQRFPKYSFIWASERLKYDLISFRTFLSRAPSFT